MSENQHKSTTNNEKEIWVNSEEVRDHMATFGTNFSSYEEMQKEMANMLANDKLRSALQKLTS